jgi:hypothetical protein
MKCFVIYPVRSIVRHMDYSEVCRPHDDGRLSERFLALQSHYQQWHRKTDFPDEREGVMSFVVDGKGYVCSGAEVTTGSSTVYLNDLWKYEPVADAWVKKAAFPAPARMHGVGFGGTGPGTSGSGKTSMSPVGRAGLMGLLIFGAGPDR